MLGCNKNYAILAFKCVLKNSKETLSTSGINTRYGKNNIETD